MNKQKQVKQKNTIPQSCFKYKTEKVPKPKTATQNCSKPNKTFGYS